MRRFLLFAPLLVLLQGCGGAVAGCPKGTVCPPPADAGRAGDAGAAADVCGGCTGTDRICDPGSRQCRACTADAGCANDKLCDLGARSGKGQCVTCTATLGCGAAAPICILDGQGGRCVECTLHPECGGGLSRCVDNRCVHADAGTEPDAGAPDAGEVDGGVDAGTEPPPCAPRDFELSCITTCPEGFVCQSTQCVLNGGDAPLQVTLRWNTTEDFDLRMDEPLPDGGVCEISYEDGVGSSSCGALGRLDLDSEAGCVEDNIDIENIIYPSGGQPTAGTYEVRVDHYGNCDAGVTQAQFEVLVRKGTQTTGFCGLFTDADSDWNRQGVGNGRPVLTFTWP